MLFSLQIYSADDDDDELFVVTGIDDAGDRPRTSPHVSLPHQAAEALRRGAAEGDGWEEGGEEKGGPPSEEAWLRKNVVVQYWQGEREIPQSWHWSANLSTDWLVLSRLSILLLVVANLASRKLCKKPEK